MNAAYFDECGVWTTRVRADGDSLDVYLDRRPFRPDSAGGLPPSAGRVWVHAPPDSPSAEAFAINSPAESAVVDLVRLAIATTFTAGEESALVRKERKAARKPHPEYEASVLSSTLSSRERSLRQARSFLAAMEWRRQAAAASGPP